MTKKEKNKILVVVAHPDDEILGCGGTILKHLKNKDEVNVLILGEGETSKENGSNIEGRQKAAQKAAKFLGVQDLFSQKLPDNQFDSLPLLKIVKIVEGYLNQVKPNVVYTHHAHDLNIDHRITFQAVLTACRPQPNFFVKKILTFEILSSTEWQVKDKKHSFFPNVYNDISDFIAKKNEALEIYKNELKKYPHPRSKEGVEVLARYRGMEAGYKFAEAFQLIRDLND